MSVVVDLASQRTTRRARELAAVCRQLTTQSMTVELALDRQDWTAAHEAAEHVLELAGRFRELRRGMLAAGRSSRRS